MHRIVNPGISDRPGLVSIDRGGKSVLAMPVPAAFCEVDKQTNRPIPKYIDHEEGTAYLNLFPEGFFHLRRGGTFDVPSGVSVQAVLDAGPHHFVGEGQSVREVPVLLVEGSAEHERWKAMQAQQEATKNTTAPASKAKA